MWENNRIVQSVYASHGAQQVWAMFEGLSGWKRIAATSPDGVTNVTKLLTTAKAHGRRVNVYLAGNDIERAWMV
jgi:hypothetical protein